MKLFDFQEEFLSDIGKAFRGNNVVVGQAATGFGKGVVIAEAVKRSILKGNVVCVAAHREEIFHQIYRNLVKFGIYPSLIEPGNHPMPGAQCYLGMVETICRRLDKGMVQRFNITFMIDDEGHMGNYYKLVSKMKMKQLLLTATPKSTGNPHLNEYTDAIVCGIPISELIRIGRLIPTKTFSLKYDFSHVKKNKGDYDERALAQEFKKPQLYDGAVNMYLKYAKGIPALAYCVNVEESNRMMLQLRDHGVKAAHMDGKTDKGDRRRIWEMYDDGRIDVVCNVGIATTGTDKPKTGCIIKNYATLSVTKDVQVGGRGARCHEGMDHFITIDAGRNYIRHGEFGEEIDWVHIYNNPKADTQERAKKTKMECDECGAVMKISLRICPYCGEITSKKEVEERLLIGASPEEVKNYLHSTLPVHLRKPFSMLTDSEIHAYGRHMNYKPSWAHVLLTRMGRK